MDINKITDIIVSEPIYLSIIVLFILAFVYSVLKKFFKLLIIVLITLIAYVCFLIYTNQDLPGDSDELIYPLLDDAKEKLNETLKEFNK